MIIRWHGLYVGTVEADEYDVAELEKAGFTVSIKGV